MTTLGVDWGLVIQNLAQLSIAYILAFPIGWDREVQQRGAGLRTFPLVAVGSCGYILVGNILVGSDAHARILYGLMTGIGFIGGGAILKERGSVRGTATAASIWITGAVGAAVAWHRYEIAIALALINYLTMRWVGVMKDQLESHHRPKKSNDKELD